MGSVLAVLSMSEILPTSSGGCRLAAFHGGGSDLATICVAGVS